MNQFVIAREKKMSNSMEYDLTELFEVQGKKTEVCSAIANFEKGCGLKTESIRAKHIYGNHQFCVETNNFWYKKYMNHKILDHLVRECLVKEYQRLGITWDLFSYEKGGCFLDFERRQKLDVARQEDAPFGEILLGASNLLQKVEEVLEFSSILEQLKHYEEFNQVAMLKLTRAEKNKHSDYAFLGTNTILLDDADFCIVPLDANCDIVEVPFRERFKIRTERGDFCFDPMDSTNMNFDACSREAIQEALIRHQIYKGWEFNFT